jgi:hypothetical protein
MLAGAQVRFVVLIIAENLSAEGGNSAIALIWIIRISKI